MDAKSVLIGVLLVAVGVLGYNYYQQQQRTVSIELPNVKIGRP
jgi:predicted negative regulator of RcsB-dependent stress response